MATSDSDEYGEASMSTEKAIRKKRLSRKEQRARKKHRHRKEHVSDAMVGGDNPQRESIGLDDAGDSYDPTPIPSSLADPSGPQSLGKWFPKAKVIKSSITYSNDHDASRSNSGLSPKASILLFYQYATPKWEESKVSQLLLYLTKIAERRVLGGRIRMAPEGVNATLSSVDNEQCMARDALRHFCLDLQRFDPHVFRDTDFKFVDKVQPDRHFKDLRLLPVKELVFYGIDETEAPLTKGGVHLDPCDFHEKLQADPDSTVVIDVRNHYEAAIGRFDGQQTSGGAEYVDPLMRKSTDWPKFLSKPETQAKLKNKTVLMYCTGGVRCERASAYLNQQMGSQVKGVYQLKGGVERYLQSYPDGGHWRGKNFVFDKREAISAENRGGDGGVVRKRKISDADRSSVETKCCVCGAPWHRYVGKKKCQTCGVPILMCDSCMSKKKETRHQLVRCPLCVQEGITVPAASVEYTENGVSGKLFVEIAESHGRPLKDSKSKVAPSVLKWGGGHASDKKQRRRLKRKPCKFGESCTRLDCFFSHPNRREITESASSS